MFFFVLSPPPPHERGNIADSRALFYHLQLYLKRHRPASKPESDSEDPPTAAAAASSPYPPAAEYAQYNVQHGAAELSSTEWKAGASAVSPISPLAEVPGDHTRPHSQYLHQQYQQQQQGFHQRQQSSEPLLIAELPADYPPSSDASLSPSAADGDGTGAGPSGSNGNGGGGPGASRGARDEGDGRSPATRFSQVSSTGWDEVSDMTSSNAYGTESGLSPVPTSANPTSPWQDSR